MKKCLTLCLCLAALLCAIFITTPEADAATDGYYTYTVSDDKATINDVDTSISGNVVIPGYLGGYQVTSISYDSFRGCSKINSITIPSSVISIGTRAFSDCTSLTSVTLNPGSSLTTIDNDAFKNCSRITKISLPTSLTTIGSSAFRGCSSITSITIPSSVTRIESNAFNDCTSLASVTLNATDCYVNNSTSSLPFIGCTKLTTVTIGNSVKTIPQSIFSGLSSIKTVNLGSNVTTVTYNAFQNCSGITKVVYCGTSADWNNIKINSGNEPLTNASRSYHSYKAANCTSPRTCIFCGQTNGSALGHRWISANCTTPQTCSLCNATTGTVQHTWVNATCTEAKYCAKCNKTEGFALGHNLQTVSDKAPTCLDAGWKAYNACTRCNMNDKVEIPATGHEYEYINTEASCTDQGYTTYICRCGHSYVENYVPELGHSLRSFSAQAPTCTEVGWYAYSACSRCLYTTYEEIKPTGHTYSVVVTPATCVEQGYTTYICCCGHSYVDNYVNNLGHSFTDYISNNDANYFEDGTKTATCTTCGATDTVTDEGSKLIPEGEMILLQPVPVNTDSGNTVRFSVEVFGEIVSYRWQYRKIYKWFDTTMEGFDTDTLTVPATGARNGYDYRCVITFADGTVLYSEPAELTVSTQINITYHPNDQVVALGYKGQFTAKADGEGIKFQWQYKRPNADQWYDTNMEGAKQPTVYIETTAARDGYQYRCKLTDVTGKVAYTEAATMTVLTFTSQPEDARSPVNGTVTFTVSASAESGFTYQWQYRRSATANWTNTSMTGYNTDTLTVSATKARNGYQYRCVLTGAKNSTIVSQSAVLYVSDPVVFNAQPQNATVVVGGIATFTVEATNAYAYQWQFYNPRNAVWKNTSADGNTTATVNVTVKSNNNNYQYRCIVYGLDGIEYISDPATLTLG